MTRRLFSGGQGPFIVVAMANLTLSNLTFTRATGPILTAIGQGDALTQGGLQDGFV
jgi:hypothetical protein